MANPVNHPQRFALNYELHARPPEALNIPEQASYLALATDPSNRQAEYESIVALCTRYGVAAPAPDVNHFQADLGTFRVKWERRTECNSFTFFRQGPFDDPFAQPVIGSVPQDWLASLPGQVLVAAHVALRTAAKKATTSEELALFFEGNPLVGSRVGDGVASVRADFRIHADGFSRFLIEDVSLTQRQAGRMVQRLTELETYLMRALLTLPLARATLPVLFDADQQLGTLISEMVTVTSEDEPALLDRLTRLAALVENTISSTLGRICAARAYQEMVERRIVELREVRVEGLSTLREFVERRLMPAMNTCETVARLQDSLSERISRATELLRTRVDIALQRQNQALLSTAARRARLQLRLQETVEGLSVAAVSYYVVGLIGYAAKAVKAAGVAVDTEIVTGIAIPIVVVIAALGVRHIRRVVQRAVW
ncbi:conserved hypothetical protein [Candidatus Accumulibacter aalborgensis]|uniref:Membrane-anchored protein n=1 Tax=Candidatus Accumulibacter aalborgensis TaxID=1860102 RepID=A0A1A8XG22_9PROT|nr:DUF3422 domain-containing protein [Candidatus Accumulibacter aalborgensis]SBT04120.1 conserved hypothetical protein [Candidatus Accumulibacter aalborgensis]